MMIALGNNNKTATSKIETTEQKPKTKNIIHWHMHNMMYCMILLFREATINQDHAEKMK